MTQDTTPSRADGADIVRESFIARVIAASARQPIVTLVLAAVAAALGAWSVARTPLDAIPDLSDVQVIVTTEWPGRSPDLVEDQLTYPISSALLSVPNARAVRGQSFFGASFVYVIFEDGTDLYWARTRVLERLSSVGAGLPPNVRPLLGPDATGVGWVYSYALVDETGAHDLADLRALQDFRIRYALASVPGVAEVASIGGVVRQVELQLDPARLRAFGVTADEVVAAVRAGNADAGAGSLEVAGHEILVRTRGYARTLEDFAALALRAEVDGRAVRVGDVAHAAWTPAPRRGLAELNGVGEVAGGIVVMRSGENARAVIARVKARLAELRASLPAGVQVVPTYDRSELIEGAVGTLRRTLLEEMAIVSLVIFVFLWHARSALVPIVTIPIGVALAFVPMLWQGITANIMSLGGIAVAIGAMVDAAIIGVENVHKRLAEWEREGSAEPGQLSPWGLAPRTHPEVVIRALQEVGPSLFFALLVITVSFLPIFALEGESGRLFKPLAFTKTYAMAFAALLSVTLAPALAVLAIRGRIPHEDELRWQAGLARGYARVVRFAVRRRARVIAGALVVLAATVPVALSLGREFMPPLDEGTLLYMPTGTPGMSATEAARVLQQMDRELRAVPEVSSVFGKSGRAESATDPAPLEMFETVIQLKPREQWRPELTTEKLIRELDEKLHYPGMRNLFWQPIQTRTEMLATGLRSEVGLKVFGPDAVSIEAASVALERALAQAPGTRSAVAERLTGGLYLDVALRREALARHGLSVAAVNDAVETALGGMTASQVLDGRARYPVSVRYARDFREEPAALARVLVATPRGAQIPLGELADVRFATGPAFVRSEGGELLGTIAIGVAGVPVVDYVERAQPVLANVALPPGVRVAWAGKYQAWETTRDRLLLVAPLTLFLVALLLYWNTGSAVETGMVVLAVPFSLVGAIWLLFALGYNTSTAVWVGVIALLGLDAQTGVVMLLYLTLAHRERAARGAMRSEADLEEAIVDGAARRLRPKLMTVAAMIAGLLPLLWSDGVGADVMKRVAAPMAGGLVSSFALELLVYPALFALWKRRTLALTQQSA
jgi:Cu(I)/Ag(I) efflux system membrane protein CusA/SilA